MAYIPISEVVLKTDFEAKDVTIINYNQTLADIKIYLERLNTNIHYIYLTGGGGGEGGPGVYYNDTLPPTEDLAYGATWFDEE